MLLAAVRRVRRIRGVGLPALGMVLCVGLEVCTAPAAPPAAEATASSTAERHSPAGAVDGERFSTAAGSIWKGAAGAKTWWWQVRFAEPRRVGAILQINGDHPRNFANAPRHYVWQWSRDGRTWHDLRETETRNERRLYRIHRLAKAHQVGYLRMTVLRSLGEFPSLREAEFYATPSAKIEFDDWFISVRSSESSKLSDGPDLFVALAHRCKGWEHVLAQHVWIGDFDEDFVSAQPRPICAFLSGSLLEWCQRTREPWRGVQEVLAHRNLPMWGACGGAQAMAILEETGVDRPWDCPRCRDPDNPKLPIYTHIGHKGEAPCGDYSKNVGERGKYKIRKVADDPVFAGLPEIFEIKESHIGQIAYPPQGWVRVATRGPGALTVNQCIRVRNRYIYAAQFHMELPGTPATSQKIMGNFLSLARSWGGYNPRGKPLDPPRPLRATSGQKAAGRR